MHMWTRKKMLPLAFTVNWCYHYKQKQIRSAISDWLYLSVWKYPISVIGISGKLVSVQQLFIYFHLVPEARVKKVQVTFSTFHLKLRSATYDIWTKSQYLFYWTPIQKWRYLLSKYWIYCCMFYYRALLHVKKQKNCKNKKMIPLVCKVISLDNSCSYVLLL